jgi:hypothetical protein
MKQEVVRAIEYLIKEIGNEYDEDDQVIIYTGLYRHSDGDLYLESEE